MGAFYIMARDVLTYSIGNSASTTLSSSVTGSSTSFPLTADTNFNAKSGEGMVVLDEGTATEELGYATTKSGGALTIPVANRGLEGGSAQSHSTSSSVKGVLTAAMWNDLIDSLANVLVKATGVLDTTKVVNLTTAQTLTNKTLTSPVLNTGVSGTAFLDEDNMASNSATKVASQQSIKAYVDTAVSAVSVSVVEQDITTNNTRSPAIIKTGWSYITGDGSDQSETLAITFGTAFTTAPIVVMTLLGYKDASNPTTVADFTTFNPGATGAISTQAQGTTTSGFNALITSSGSAFTSGKRFGFSWIAIGS